MILKIALLQLLPGGSVTENLNKGKEACMKASQMGADIALFPEMWSDGYDIPQDEEKLNALAITKDSAFIEEFKALAKELKMAIGITFLEANEGRKPLNSVIIFDRNGNEKLHYSKVHTCDFGDECMLESGKEFKVVNLDIGRDVVRIGSMICFDREFPESARILMLKGAEVILAPNACPMEINRLSALRTRAYENKVAVATCNYPSPHPDCNGHSTVFDGVAWKREEPGVRDMCVFEAPEEEGVYIAEIDMDQLREYRENEVMGDRYRHTEAYGLLMRSGILKTDRLILRRWEESDVEDLFKYAVDPDVGPICGWPVHKTIQDSMEVIRNVFCNKELYAICLKEDDRAIGTIELMLNGNTDMTDRDDECELGFWLAKPFWGQGIMPEAVNEMLRHAFADLGMNKVWCGYYEGNEKSKRVQEKCGFIYQHKTENVDVPLMNEKRTGHVNLMTKEDWEKRAK